MITSQEREIRALVTDIRSGRLLLPELQRRYVWKASQVRDLFDSLYHEYPSGQLLIWETDDVPFSRAVSVDNLEKSARRPQLLLDGQQRLTSLAAIILGEDLMVRGSRQPIDIAFNPFTEKFEVTGLRQRREAGWISLSKLFTQGALSVLPELKLDLSLATSKEPYDRLMKVERIDKYRYRINVLEDLDYEEVTHIFVRVNSGGTILGNADLTLAQVSSRWRGITDEFDAFLSRPMIKKLNLDTGVLLRSLSVMLGGPTGLSQFFRGGRHAIGVAELEAAWKRVKRAMDQAVQFLTTNCWIDRFDLLPTKNILIPLVAYFDRFGENVLAEQMRELQRWVYTALIWSRYSATVETRMDQDIAALSREEPIANMIRNIEDQVGRRPVTERELQDQRKNSPYMLMAYVLARRATAADWFNGVVIGPGQDLELHHIWSCPVSVDSDRLRD